MRSSSYREQDYAFGQLILALRTTIGLTQAGLADLIGVTRRTISQWEAGSVYPKAEHLKAFIALGVRQQAFPPKQEEQEIRALWRAAHQKMLLDERWLQELLGQQPSSLVPVVEESHTANLPAAGRELRMNWGDALDVSIFYGREEELAELDRWIIQDHCRLIAILGMGGIGKSTLVSLLGSRLAPHFETLLWRSVRDAPSCEELVADCITIFSEIPPNSFPASLEQRISQLLACLQANHCLLVIDNLETLLASDDREGGYLPGYEGYGRLIERLGESAHQSCVLLTSREKPREIEPLEGIRSPVRSLRLTGMDEQVARVLLTDKGLSGTPAAWQRLVVVYAGNPLALKIVGQTVSDLFGGNIDRFLREEELVFNGMRLVLRRQMERLSTLEHLLLTWLAVLREWTELNTLIQVLHPRVQRTQVLEALEALSRRSLLERGQQASFGLQSVVMEYLSNELSEHLSQEIMLSNPQQVRSVSLEQGQAKDYVRQTQLRLLVHPLIERLRSELGTDVLVEAHLLRLLAQFRAEDATTQGYGPANIISLLKELRGHLRGLDLSRLSIRGAYLQGVEMQDATLAGAMLHEVIFTQALDAVLFVAVSTDGQYVAAGSNTGQIRVWRGEERRIHLSMRGHTDRVSALVFSPDEQTLITAGWDCTVKVWDVASGATIWTGRDHHAPVTSLAIGPNGKLISGSYDGVMHLWDLRTGTHLSRLQTHDGGILTLAWSTDGRWLASGGHDSVIRLWDVEQGALLQELRGHHNSLYKLAFAPETFLLASGGIDQMIKLWDVETGVCRETLEGHKGAVVGLAFSPNGETLASAGYDTTIRLWNSQSWQCRHLLQGHNDVVTSVAFLPEGDWLLSSSLDQTVRTWDVMSGQNVRTMQGYALALFTLCWSPNGHFLLSGGSDATLTLWDMTTRTQVQVLRGHSQQVHAVAWSHTGNRVASASSDQTVRIWDIQTGSCTHILRGHTDVVYSVDWSPDGRWLASGSYDHSVRLWDVQEGTCRVESEHARMVYAVAWSPDGQLLASAGEDGVILIRRATDGSILQRFEHTGFIGALRWSANGEQLVSGVADGDRGVLSIWDVRQGTLVRTLEGHSLSIWGVDWSPQQDILVSAGADGTIRWWNLEQGVNLATVLAHEAWARAVRVSPDGKTSASCGDDGIIKLWDMQSHQHLATLRAERPYERLNISGTLGLTNAQQAVLRALGASIEQNATPPF